MGPPPVDGKSSATGISGSRDVKTVLREQARAAKEQDKKDCQTENVQLFSGVKFCVAYEIKVVAPKSSRAAIEEIIEKVFNEVEAFFSYNESSEMMRIGTLPANTPMTLSYAMKEVLACCSEVNARSNGLFDPTVMPLAKYVFEILKTTKKLPDPTDKKYLELREGVGWSNLVVEGDTLTKKKPGTGIDLGGVAKGWTIDKLLKLICDAGFPNVFVDWGGDIKGTGKNPANRPWVAGIVQPSDLTPEGIPLPMKDNADLIKTVPLSNAAIATSGDYQQAYDGGYYHIFNPFTGEPLKASQTSIASASVQCTSCMLADCLATTALLLGDPSKARDFMEKYRLQVSLLEYWLYVREGEKIIEGRKKRRRGFENEDDMEDRQRLFADILPSNVIVVGGGLAGLSAVVEAFRCGANVTLIEKEDSTGGNSAKATSGINGWGTQAQLEQGIVDSEALFERDTYLSGKGGTCEFGCVRMLSTRSAEAVQWLREEFGVPLSVLSQCGGHSRPRTHRAPDRSDGTPTPIGWDIMQTMAAHVKGLPQDKVKILNRCKVTRLLKEDAIEVSHQAGKSFKTIRVVGVEYQDASGKLQTLKADSVVLCTGGYCSDHGPDSLLAEFTPNHLPLSTTNGSFATGDGIKMGREIGAALVDMDKVQLHPTGFIDPKDPMNPTKYLGPEALRGSGGILLKQDGTRFVNELDLRSKVSNAILSKCSPLPLPGGRSGMPFAWCILNTPAMKKFGPAAVNFYKDNLGLFQDAENVEKLAQLMEVDVNTLRYTLQEYSKAVKNNYCPQTGKGVFPADFNVETDQYVVAKITPSLHYCMGGLRISPDAEVQMMLPEGASVFGKRCPIFGLFGAGECTGGVHGANRLAGNSLLECVVFGRIAGERAASVKTKHEGALKKDDWTPLALREVRDTAYKFGVGTKVFRFNLPGPMQQSGLRMGQYIAMRCLVDGNYVGGYYSPITRPDDFGVLGILARTDIPSPMAPILNTMRPGDIMEFKAMEGLDLELFPDKVTYKGRKVTKIGLLAGGTGVAPMLQIIRGILKLGIPNIQMSLVYAAEREHEFSLIDSLDLLVQLHPKEFRYFLVVAHPPQGWTQGVGFIDMDAIKQKTFPPTDESLIVICGPPRMCDAMKGSLKKLGFQDDWFFSY